MQYYHLHDKPTTNYTFRCYVSCDIRMENIGNLLFSRPSTCGADCFEITESVLFEIVLGQMTMDRCPFVPGINAIKEYAIPAGNSTGEAYTICKAEFDTAAQILFGMNVLNKQCLSPMKLLIPDDVGNNPHIRSQQYQVSLASVRYASSNTHDSHYYIFTYCGLLINWSLTLCWLGGLDNFSQASRCSEGGIIFRTFCSIFSVSSAWVSRSYCCGQYLCSPEVQPSSNL